MMLYRYVAFKKENLNLYCIFEVIPSDVENGLQSIRLIPKLVKGYEIKKLSYEINNNIIEPCYLKRVSRKAPFYNIFLFNPEHTGYKFKMKFNYVNYSVPVIASAPYLGSRWSENAIEYLFAFDANETDINEIQNIECVSKSDKDVIINFKNDGITIIDMGLTDPTELNNSFTTPNYVVKGWLKNSINEKCPITLAELTAQNICATPCFHAISHEAAVEWISSNNSCPVCRKECSISKLIRL
jgi:hypothetical protein